MILSKELKEAIKLHYGSENWNHDDYETKYLQGVSILKHESANGDPNAIYFLSRAYFGQQFIPHVEVGDKYEDDSLGYQLLRQSFELKSPFAVINGALRVAGGISDEMIQQAMIEDPDIFTRSMNTLRDWADHDEIFFADYVLANFFYWGDNLYFGDTDHRYDLALNYFRKAFKGGMIVDRLARNILNTVIHLQNESELIIWFKILFNAGYRESTILMMMELKSNPWAHAMVYIHGLGKKVNIKKAYTICKKHHVDILLPNFHKKFFSLKITYTRVP